MAFKNRIIDLIQEVSSFYGNDQSATQTYAGNNHYAANPGQAATPHGIQRPNNPGQIPSSPINKGVGKAENKKAEAPKIVPHSLESATEQLADAQMKIELVTSMLKNALNSDPLVKNDKKKVEIAKKIGKSLNEIRNLIDKLAIDDFGELEI